MSKPTVVVPYKSVNGLYSLKQLEPVFIHFAKSDVSGIKRLSKEDYECTWGNLELGRFNLSSKNVGKTKTHLIPDFIRNPFNNRENLTNGGIIWTTKIVFS